MELTRLEVTNWRGLSTAVLDFGSGVTIIGGPNECGKTSLRSALHAALVMTGSGAKEKKKLETFRPWDTKLYPKVQLDFKVDDKVVMVEKEFLRTKNWASLKVNGKLVANDGEVQRELEKLLGPSLDWVDILWGVQGLVAFDKDAPDSVKGRLATAAQDTVIPQVAQLKEAIDKEWNEYWTEKTQRPKSKLQDLRTASDEAMKAELKLKEEIKAADRRVEDLDVQKLDLDARKQKLKDTESQWQRGQESLGVWEIYARAKAEAANAEQTLKSIEQWVRVWQSTVSGAAELFSKATAWKQSCDKLKALVDHPPSRADYDAVANRKNYLELSVERDKFAALENMQVPTAAELKAYRQIENDLRDVESRLKAGALSATLTAEAQLKMELTRDDGEKEIHSLSKTETNSFNAEKGFELVLPGVARLQVESGSQSVADDIETRKKLAQDLKTFLEKWNANDLQELQMRATEKDAQIKQLRPVDMKQLTLLRGKVADADSLDGLSPEEKEALLNAMPAALVVAESNWKMADSEHTRANAEHRKLLENNDLQKFETLLDNLQNHCKLSMFDNAKALVFPTSKADATGSAGGSPASKPGSAGVPPASINPEPATSMLEATTIEWLKSLDSFEADFLTSISTKQAELKKLQAAIIRPEGEETSKDRLTQLISDKTRMAESVADLETKINQEIGSIKAQGDLYSRLVAAQETSARASAEEKRVEKDAMAIMQLRQAFDEGCGKLRQDVVAPLQDRVTECLSQLTSGFYKGVAFDAALKVNGVRADSSTDIVLDEISFGTREQLSFITRLCLAQLLAKDASKQVVILDDNLVHTDDARMPLACGLLETAAQVVQVIIFTCHPKRYSAIENANRFTLCPRDVHRLEMV